jgi:hypothetical protein
MATPAVPATPSAGGTGLTCKDSSSDRSVVQCDNTYRDTALNCKNGNMDAPCYKKNMPMKDTAKQTFKDVSPYLYAYPRDPTDKKRPYSGEMVRGQQGGPSEVFAPIGEPPKGVAKQKACINQITMDVSTLDDAAKLSRLQLDNCANQFILNTAVSPFYKENVTMNCGPQDNPYTCTSVDLCQPLRMMDDPAQEYLASDYIKGAWIKLLNDPSYRINKDAKAEPHLPDGIKIANKIAVPTVPEIRINQLATTPYEEIVDPTHPFSPRWDFSYNERDKYSPLTKNYSGDDKNAVFCAGDKNSKIYKVDVLTFREKSIKFDKKVTDRIDFNKNCIANSGIQANPCCKVEMPKIPILGIPDPDPTHWTCKPQPCAVCYDVHAGGDPVCSTDWANKTDRKSLQDKKIGGIIGEVASKIIKTITGKDIALYEYLPLHPAVWRIAGLGSAVANMALSKLPPTAMVSQATAALNSNLNVLSKMPGASLVKDAMPLLQGKQQLGDKIVKSVGNMAKGMVIQSIPQFATFSAVLQSPQALLQNLAPDLPYGMVEGLVNGQVNIMAHIPLNNTIGQALATATSLQKIMGTMTPDSLLSDATGLLKSHVAILNALPTDLSLAGAQKLLDRQIDQLTSMPSNMLMSEAQKQLGASIAIPGLGNIAGSMSVGDALGMVKNQGQAMNEFRMNIPLSGFAGQLGDVAGLFQNSPADLSVAAAQNLLGSQVAQLAELPGNMSLLEATGRLGGSLSLPGIGNISGSMPIKDVMNMLNVSSLKIAGLNLDAPLGDFSKMMNSQLGDILKLPQNIDLKSVTGMLGSMGDTLKGLANNLPIKDIQNFVGDQMKGLLNMEGLAAGKLKDLVGDQLNTLNGLMPDGLKGFINGSMGDIKGTLSGITGKINGFSDMIGDKIADLKGTLSNALGDVTKSLDGIKDTIKDAMGGVTDKLAEVQGIVKDQIAGLTKMLDVPIQQVTGILNQQLAGLSKLTGKLPIGAVSKALDGNVVGAVMDIPAIKNLPGMDKINDIMNGNFTALIPGMDKMLNPITLYYIPVLLTPFPRQSKCTPAELGKANDTPMEKLCSDLRAPYTNINKLKMRYHNPDDAANITMKSGVQEGLWFKDYFYDKENKAAHMPYPRLWDTGRGIQADDKRADQDPNDISGGFTAVVGVGREGATDAVNAGKGEDEKHNEERCLYGGWGADTTVGGVTIKIPDPVTSWTELKLYQGYTTRETGVACMGRYDRAFRYRGTEYQMLLRGGWSPSTLVETKCDVDDKGVTVPGSCRSQGVADDADATAAAKKWSSKQIVQRAWPLAWRGYFSAKDATIRFPKLGGGGSNVEKGLDKARCGDIIMMPTGGSDKDAKPGLPKLGRAKCSQGLTDKESAVHCQAAGKNCYIDVEEADNGKWPDVCGTTDSFGELKIRRIFKPGNMRKAATDELQRIDWTASCEDTKLAECEMKPWNDIEVYHVNKDVVKGYAGASTPATP